MQDYIHANYTTSIEVDKPAAEVFSCITQDVSKFWPEDVEGESTRLHDEFVFRSGDTHYSKNRVVELVPNKKVVWLVTESLRKTDNYEWTGTRMIFELSSTGGPTLLQFTYDGPVAKKEYDRLVMVCDMVIKDRLHQLLTRGSAT